MVDRERTVAITVNGEIYNYRRLKRELTAKHEFTSDSDSEVVLHGYKEWGLRGLLQRIEGMFAFVVHDMRDGTVHLVRDRAGIKPLYYTTIGGGLSWASELKALVAFHGSNALQVDNTALYDFLTYKYIPRPKSLYVDVHKLEPGHYVSASVHDTHLRKEAYWELKVSPIEIAPAEAAGEVVRLLASSVRDQLVSDVPLGCFLSGGIDSTAIIAEASEVVPALSTYSIGFDDTRHDETRFAALAAEHFHTTHHSKRLNSGGAAHLFGELRSWYDEPFADTSALPTFLVSQYTREQCVVALSGDGGDEVFGGYNWYRQYRESTHLDHLLDFGKPIATYLKKRFPRTRIANGASMAESRLLLRGVELYAKLMGGLLRQEKTAYRKLWSIPEDYDDYWFFRKFYRADLPRFSRLQYLDYHTFLPEDILTKVDRVSMAVSLEVRVPMLDTKLVEFAFSTPESIRVPGGDLKGLLKSAYAQRIPSEILNRPKKGFSIPMHTWRDAILDGARSKQERILQEHFQAEAALPLPPQYV